MTVKALIQQLSLMDPQQYVMLDDGNGKLDVEGAWQSYITQLDTENSADCEERVGEKVVVVGR